MRLLIPLAFLALAGCSQSQTREQTATDKVDKISVSGTLTIPTADGPRPVPVAFTIDRHGTEDQRKESDTRSGLDGAAIGREIAAALGPVIAAGVTALTGSGTAGAIAEQGVDWLTGLLGAGAAGGTAAGTGYMALRRTRRQRDELIEGIEKSKDVLGDEEWEKVKAKLASVQSADTQRAIWEATP